MSECTDNEVREFIRFVHDIKGKDKIKFVPYLPHDNGRGFSETSETFVEITDSTMIDRDYYSQYAVDHNIKALEILLSKKLILFLK